MADKELALIDKVELRIALASSDEKFQGALDLYLCPLLLKLSSPHAAARQQILKFIQGVIPRLNGSKSVQLPTLKLIEQAQNPKCPTGQDASTVQLYSLLFASKGIDRMTDDQKHDLIPILAKNIGTYAPNVSSRLFHLFTKATKNWKTPDRGTDEFAALREKLSLSATDERFLIGKIEQLFLLNPVINNDGVIPRGYTCPGLSASEVSFLTYDAGVSYKGDDLAVVKKDITSFIPIFHDENLITVLAIGAVDGNEQISNTCSGLLRKITIPYEDEALINHIISLYIGDKNVPRSPVKSIVQERFISILSNSVVATKNPSVPIITSIGLNAARFPRLKSATILFIQWVARNGGEALISGDYSVTVAAQLRNNLHADGWPKFQDVRGADFSTRLNHRRLQYEALGDILKKDPSLIMDFSYIEFLFDSLTGDIPEVRTTIQAALGSLMVHLTSLPDTSKSKLKSTMSVYLQDDVNSAIEVDALHAVKYTALKYINAAFPFHDAGARMLNIFGTSTKNKSDIIEEATKGLHPYWFNIIQSTNTDVFKSTSALLGAGNVVAFPKFSETVSELKKAIEYSAHIDSASLHHSISTAVLFGLRVLVSEAISGKSTVVVQDQEWETRIDKGLEHDAEVISLTMKHLENLGQLQDFLSILSTEIIANGNGASIAGSSLPIFGKIYIKLLSLVPQPVVETQKGIIAGLLDLILSQKNVKDEVIYHASNAIGIIASHPAVSDVQARDILMSILSKNPNESLITPADVITMGFLYSRLLFRGRSVLSGDHLRRMYRVIVESLKSKDFKLCSSAVTAIGEFSKFGGFGPVLQDNFIDQAKKEIMEAMEPMVKKKLDERSMIAWALLSLSEKESIKEEYTAFESVLYETHITKQVETLFTSGEAFSIIASGWDSKFLTQHIDVQDASLLPDVSKRENRLDFILTKVLAACSNTKPALRKAGCIWLLSLTQYCGHLPAITGKSGVIHIAFMRFLSDRDELVQEAASRGLSIIYELGDNDLKETLVKSLLKSFTESTSTSKLSSGTVSADTELFEPGVLRTHDGSVSTYKDILSLASEVGDPSLVYKFMSMAKNSALWSSRKGIAFGLGSIMSKSSLDKMLFENTALSNRLIPKLYRYRFDPSSSVSKSMNDIWSSIVPDTAKAVEQYHDAILKELLAGMGNKEWRVREASTVALNDLVQTLPNDKYESKMEDIWTMAFRSIDDIKDSVRKAGGGLTRTLSQMLVNSISVESGSSQKRAHDALSKLLPFLLGSKGILSDADDVRDFSLKTILSLVKKSGKAICPFIGELLEQFILLMSTLEPQIINYLALNADKYKLRSDDIDAKRMQSIGSSPMMNALEKLIDLVNDEVIEDVVFRLQSTVKKSVGLPSKVAASRVIVMLIIRHLHIIQPFGETLLNTCISQQKDRNTTISSSFATAAGYACRVCTVDVTVKYGRKISDMYFDSEDERTRLVASVASEAVSKYSGDRFASVASAFLPVAFIAMNDPNKEVAKAFENEWSENTSGNGAIRLYMPEICDLTEKCMSSSLFSVRQTAAKSIAKACDAIDGSSNASFNVEKLFDVLINASQGRSWSGKEDVVSALVSLSGKSKAYIDSHPELLAKVTKVVITEAKRRNKAYKKHAIVSFGKFVRVYPTKNIQEEAMDIFEPLFRSDYYGSDDEAEDTKELKKVDSVNERSSPKNLKREADRIRALTSLTDCFQCYSVGIYFEEFLFFVLKCITETINPDTYITTWRSQLAVVEALTGVCDALKGVQIDLATAGKLEYTWLSVFNNNTASAVVENVKVQTVRAAVSMVSIGDTKLSKVVVNTLTQYLTTETNQVVIVEIKNALGSS